MEQRNNKRLITSNSLDGVFGPGDMVEIDACEADVSLVSMFDNNQCVGRPVVYFMMDVYTKVILAVSIAFDNNSLLGVTNLFLNLADNKKEYCRKVGIDFNNHKLWVSNIIPRRIRVDRGSEFKSENFIKICNELGIELQIVSGGTGSLKGNIEQSFHQMHSRQNVHLEKLGLIEKRYESKHHMESALNIEQYTKIVINFVLAHNQQYLEKYPLTKEMLEEEVKPIPCMLWEYGVKKYGIPRPISSEDQYLYNLMTPIKAKLSRRGISYRNLWYLPLNDIQLSREMFNAGTKKISYQARMDMRNVGAVYYIRDGKLIKAPLNPNITGNVDYDGFTMKQYEDYLKVRKQMDAEGKIHNEKLSAYNYAVNESIVSNAKKEQYSNKNNMRLAREVEKQLVSSKNGMEDRLLNDEGIAEIESQIIEKKNEIETSNSKCYEITSFEDALNMFNEW